MERWREFSGGCFSGSLICAASAKYLMSCRSGPRGAARAPHRIACSSYRGKTFEGIVQTGGVCNTRVSFSVLGLHIVLPGAMCPFGDALKIVVRRRRGLDSHKAPQ